MRLSLTDLGLVIHDALILICCQVQTNLSARLVSAHSLSNTYLLILMTFTRNILLLPQWRNCSELLTYMMSLILSKKLTFTTNYNAFIRFIVAI